MKKKTVEKSVESKDGYMFIQQLEYAHNSSMFGNSLLNAIQNHVAQHARTPRLIVINPVSWAALAEANSAPVNSVIKEFRGVPIYTSYDVEPFRYVM